jgi:uncharacterized protein YcbK (DUF882 family)
MAKPTNDSEVFLNQLIAQIQLHLQTVGGTYITIGNISPSPLPLPGFKTWTGYSIPGSSAGVAPASQVDPDTGVPNDNNTLEGISAVAATTSAQITNDSTDPDIEINIDGVYKGHSLDPKLTAVKKVLGLKETPPPKTSGTFNNEAVTSLKVANKVVSCPTKDQIYLKNGKINYELQLSPNIKLKDLTTKSLWPHNLKQMHSGNANYAKQKGIVKVEELVCNLKSLAVNIVEPLLAQYPGFMPINSAFRSTSTVGGKSQHMVGEAIDVQWLRGSDGKGSNYSTEKYMEIANWLLKNLPVDQVIYEHTNTYGRVWLHISHRRDGVTNRFNPLTMHETSAGEVYTPGFYNRYPSK